MKRRTIALALIGLAISSVSMAVTDPDPDQVGVYFDEGAVANSLHVGPMMVFNAYVVATRPSGPIHGFVLGYRIEVPAGQESSFFMLTEYWPDNYSDECFNHGCGDGDRFEGYFRFNLEAPLPGGLAVTLIRWELILTGEMAVEFFITPAAVPGSDSVAPSYFDGAVWVPLGVSSGDEGLPVARVNGGAPVSAADMPFGAVKALYR